MTVKQVIRPVKKAPRTSWGFNRSVVVMQELKAELALPYCPWSTCDQTGFEPGVAQQQSTETALKEFNIVRSRNQATKRWIRLFSL